LKLVDTSVALVALALAASACAPAAATPTQPPVAATAPTTAPTTAQPTATTASVAQPTAAPTQTTPTTAAPAAKPTAAAQPTTAAAPAATPAPAAKPVAAAPAKLNLNTATREQLLAIPNMGDRMVREFFEYRPYTTIGQFRREIGKYVSQEQVRAYEQYVFVPIDPNRADADTLQQIAGVTAAVAQQLIAARPYANVDAFVIKLGQLVPAEQAGAARFYLAAA
jgi:DNA uptake protein ComE-like DNA-binding protein